MRCHNCGAELEEGVRFCRECGSKVEAMKKRFCRDCGKELPDGVKFCPECGAKVNIFDTGVKGVSDASQGGNYSAYSQETSRIKRTEETEEFADLGQMRNSLQQSYEENLKEASNNSLLPLLIAVIALALLAFLTMRKSSSSEKRSDSPEKPTILTTNGVFDEIVPIVSSTATLEAGTEFAYMSDAWNVYIAKAVSDTVVKVESWHKTSQSDKSLKYRGDLGSFRIRDEENGFSWIDDTHTAFTLVIQDKNNSDVKKPTLVIFTININESDKYKGTDYDKNIACYTYVNDDWHTYRAIPLTDTLVKIECWYRTSSGFFDKHCFAWDVGVIDTEKTATDFEWGGSNHVALTITMKDPANKSYWKEAQLTSFILENENYKYATVKDYLEGIERTDKQAENSETDESTEVKEETEEVDLAETDAVPERENSDEETAEKQMDVQSSEPDMPVMKGTNLDSIVKAAEHYGLAQPFEDVDYGHGTMYRVMGTDDSGLMLGIVYSSETKEILMGTITTMASVTSEDQESFIKALSKELCPTESSEEVESWVKSNYGNTAYTTIDGIVYELGFGPMNNALFYAGQTNWEEWELSHE